MKSVWETRRRELRSPLLLSRSVRTTPRERAGRTHRHRIVVGGIPPIGRPGIPSRIVFSDFHIVASDHLEAGIRIYLQALGCSHALRSGSCEDIAMQVRELNLRCNQAPSRRCCTRKETLQFDFFSCSSPVAIQMIL